MALPTFCGDARYTLEDMLADRADSVMNDRAYHGLQFARSNSLLRWSPPLYCQRVIPTDLADQMELSGK